MTKQTLEARVTALEAQVFSSKRLNSEQGDGVTGRTNPQLLETMFGHLSDSPLYENVVRTIEENRQLSREQAERDTDLAETQ